MIKSVKTAKTANAFRQSNIELLRIIAMLMIIACHFSVYGGFNFSQNIISVNKLWIQFIQVGGEIGVDIFVIISGYFLISAKSFKTNKALKLWVQIFFYSVLIFLIFVALSQEPFSIKKLIFNIFPITFSNWWFASTYFALYLLTPFINIFLNSIDKKVYQKFLILLTVCWCLIPTFTLQSFGSNNLLWFIYLYSLAGYIKLYGNKTKIKGHIYILLGFGMAVLTWLSAVSFDILGTKISFFGKHTTFFYGMQSPLVLASSLFFFIGFLKIDIGYKRLINVISSATFGVYLIHSNEYVNEFIWKSVFKNATFSDSKLLIPYSLFATGTVFVICTLIELLRIYLIERYYMPTLNIIAQKLDKAKEKLLSLKFFK